MDGKQESFDQVYEVCDELGNGQYAVVNLCRHKTTGEKYAAKCIHKSGVLSVANGVDVQSIRNEVAILKMLNHDNIVRLFQVFETRTSITLVLEYVEGGELFARLAEKDRLDEDEASSFMHQLLVGVAFMHQQRVVHLDLKPENIMLAHAHSAHGVTHRAPHIKIIDFGLAHRCEAGHTINVESHGTPEFISPEVLACDPVSLSADMWTVGVIIYVMLTGSSPFTAKNDAAIFRKILAAQYQFEGTISEYAKHLIRGLLLRKPEQRLTAEQALQHAWFNPESEEHAVERKRSVINRESLQKLKKYVSAKLRWRKTVDLITVVNHFSQMATYKRSTSHFELSREAMGQATSSSVELPSVKLNMPTPPHSPTAPAASKSCTLGAQSSSALPDSQKGAAQRLLKPITQSTRTLSGPGQPSTSPQQRSTGNSALNSLRALLKPISKPSKNS